MTPAGRVMTVVGVYLRGLFGVLVLALALAPILGVLFAVKVALDTGNASIILWILWVVLLPLMCYPIGNDAWQWWEGRRGRKEID